MQARDLKVGLMSALWSCSSKVRRPGGRRGRLAVLATLATVALAAPAMPNAPASGAGRHVRAAASDGRQQAFQAAAAGFHVPVQVLLAVSYNETQWEAYGGRPSYAAGYGPMNLTDLTQADLTRDGFTSPLRTPDLLNSPAMHTAAPAAALAGVDRATAETDDTQNIRAGAALLASYEKQYNHRVLPADPSGWYVAVARYSQAAQPDVAQVFADEVYATIRSGAQRTTQDGQAIVLPPDPRIIPDRAAAVRLQLAPIIVPPPDSVHDPAQLSDPECPADLRCTYSPDGYWQYGSHKNDYGDHDIADRPKDLPIRYITLHDNELTGDTTLWLFHDPTYLASAHYEVFSDGQVVQMMPVGDIAWDTGNESFYQHSIGIEQEGFAIDGHTWYTGAMYQATAKLVKYLAKRFGIPLDRAHILGHDNIPGGSEQTIALQHWDPGPYWDWARFMDLVGARIRQTAPRTSDVVTIAPVFQANRQVVTGCQPIQGLTPYPGPYHGPEWPDLVHQDCPADFYAPFPSQPTSFVWLRTAPNPAAPLLSDPYLHPGGSAGSIRANDWGDQAATGEQFVVAGRKADWTAIWFAGRKAWFYNPPGIHRAAIPTSAPMVITPKAGKTSIPVFMTSYPEPSAYPSVSLQHKDPQPPVQAPAGKYSIPAGQAYVAAGPAFNTDWYNAYNVDGSAFMDRTDFAGATTVYLITYNHRMAFVGASDVDVTTSGA